MKHKDSWVNLDLGFGLAALSPLPPRGNGTIETFVVWGGGGHGGGGGGGVVVVVVFDKS